ncbi:hypothetical protein BT93_G1331 [Corymbia citriodora subsp. variegata]|nr:hypothetical protein BT93_G1331 [Corymbia citriodora subsp. variegata]KAF8020890.1 hypothetical protein BT93_G1331 [Corymbia citriodora subsp. variegata]
MGSSHSVQEVRDEDESQDGEEDDDEEEDEEDGNAVLSRNELNNTHLVKKVLEQEPEMLPCYASASPLSPQLSTLGTPRMGPSIKVWDPYNVLAPPPPLPPPPPVFSRSYSSSTMEEDRGAVTTEVFLISHGECEASLRPDLVSGRCAAAGLTTNGKRQARALAVLMNSHGVRFSAVYSSPLDRARSMAALVCQEMNFSSEQIQLSDALTEMSQGQWEGCPVSEVYTPEILGVMERLQPDFSVPGGESLREVEFRMVHFLNGTVLGLPEKLRLDFSLHSANENNRYSHQNAYASSNFISDRDGPSLPSPRSDMPHRHRQGLVKKKSGKSRLQYVTTTGDHDPEDENSPQEVHPQNTLHDLSERSSLSSISSCVGIFTHPTAIKCLITGIMGCSPLMSHKICVEDSSVTVLHHSWKTGWQIKRLNDTSHLRLL